MPATTHRKKPVEIQAIQFDGANADEVTTWLDDNEGAGHAARDEAGPRANPGDWVIRGVKSEFYPCKPDIFASTYDPIVDAEIVDDDPVQP